MSYHYYVDVNVSLNKDSFKTSTMRGYSHLIPLCEFFANNAKLKYGKYLFLFDCAAYNTPTLFKVYKKHGEELEEISLL